MDSIVRSCLFHRKMDTAKSWAMPPSTDPTTMQATSINYQQLQQAILEKVALNYPLPDILSALCLHVEQIVSSSVCSITLVDERTGTLTVGAVSTGDETACTILDGVVPGEFAGACGTAVHTKTVVIIHDTETDPRWASLREFARPLGIKSCWSIPIMTENQQVLGTFAISHLHPRTPALEHLKLLESASYLAGVAIQRKKTEDERRDSEARFRDLYESAPLAYITSALDGTILTANQQTVELLGFEKKALIGRSVLDLYAPTPHGREKAQHLHEQIRQGQEICDEELVMQRRDGSHVWISLTIRLIRDAEGHLLERRALITDISARKQTEDLHHLQRSALEHIALGNPLPEILETLCNQVELIVPHAICSILVLDHDTQCLKFQAGPSVPSALAEALDGMIPGPCAGSCGTATFRGEPVYVSNTATDPSWADLQDVAQRFHIGSCWSYPIFSQGKHVLGSFAISSSQPQAPTSFTIQLLETASYLAGIAIRRWETDQALEESEQRYRALYEDNPSMYFTIALDGTILSVNQFGAQQLGYSTSELQGQPVFLLLLEKDRAAVQQKFRQCVQNPEKIHNWEFQKIRKDGSRIWVHEMARMVKDHENHDVCLIVCDNITEHKEAERRNRQHEQAIRELYEITASPNRSFDHQVRSLLELGCRYFQLPIGLLTHRINDELELQFVCSSDPAYQEGTRVPLSHTFCSSALFADAPIGFEHAATSKWRHHPGYYALGLEAYLGTKVLTGTESYGTFCFTGPEPYSDTFSEADKDLLQLIAKWVGTELERLATESALQTNHALMKAVLEGTTDAFFVKDLEGCYLMVNTACKQFFHKTEHEIIGKTDEDIFSAPTVKLVKQQDQKVFQTGSTYTFEEEIDIKGEKRTFLTTKGPYRDTQGHVIGLFGNARDITQRKQAQEKLQEIHLALSHAMPGIAQIDPQGCYIEVNDFYASMLGYLPVDLIGTSWKPTVHTDDLPLAMKACHSLLENGKGEFEARAVRKDGSIFFKHVLMVKRLDAQGRMVGHYCFMRDVTERRQAEETLRTIIEATSSVVSTDFFHSLLRHLTAALKVKYAFLTECTDSTNTGVKTLAFLQGEEFVENVTYDLTGTPCEHVIQGEFCCIPQNVQKLYPLDQDLVALHAESYIGLPLVDASGNIIGHIAVLHEDPMTMNTQAESLLKIFAGRAGAELERHRADTALRRSEGRLRQIIDLVPHFIFAKDQNGTFILANQAVADVYGTTLDQLIGKTDADFNPCNAEVEHFQKDDQEVLKTGQVNRIQEEQITDSAGDVRFLQTTKIPFVFADTTLPSILGISIDITEQRHAKEQLEEAYGQLRDMTTRLKAAEESERKRIARELHDEFGQMLTGLKFDMAWFQRRLSEPASEGASKVLLEKIEAMSTLTDQLIHTVRRIATSLRPSILDDLGLLPALEWHVQDFQQRTGISCVFSTNLDGHFLELSSDRATALFRITQELFTNILRHAEASEVNVSLAQQGDWLSLSIVDNGRGLQDRYKTNQTTSLGLLGIKERATSLGGEFVITAKTGSGTHATVRLPLIATSVS